MTIRASGAIGLLTLAGVLSCRPASNRESSAGASPDSAAGTAATPIARGDTTASDAPTPDSPASPVGVEHYPEAVLAHVADSLAKTPRTGHVLRNHPTFQTIQLRRVASGVPEVHDQWTDVMIFQSGHAALLLGGRVTGGQVMSPGEHRGGTIAGGHSQPVSPGDLLVIPAGTPHQVQIARRDSLRYITVKVPAR